MQAVADEYYQAFTEPSMDFFWCYIRVFCLVAVIGYAAWYFLIESRREVINMKVNLNDIGCEIKVAEEGSEAEEKPKKKGAKKGAGSSTAKKGDTKDTTAKDAAEPTEYRSMSLKKEFNSRGPYALLEDGTKLTKEAYAKVYAIMNKHVWIKFHIVKRDLVENRYGLY